MALSNRNSKKIRREHCCICVEERIDYAVRGANTNFLLAALDEVDPAASTFLEIHLFLLWKGRTKQSADSFGLSSLQLTSAACSLHATTS